MKTNKLIAITTQLLANSAIQIPSQYATPVQVVVEHYLTAKSIKSRKKYLFSLHYHLIKLVCALGNPPIANITGSQVDAVVFGSGLAPRTIRLKASTPKTFFRWSRSQGFLPPGQPTPADHLHVSVPPSRPAFLTPSELEKLLGSAQDVEITLWLALSAFAGLRPAELEQLNWDDIKPGQVVRIPCQMSMCGSLRVVPILPVLDAWLGPLHGVQGLVIPIKVVSRKVHRFARGRGIQWGRNALRHSFCAYRLAQTQNPSQTPLEAGHAQHIFGHHFLQLVTHAEAQQFFSLTPEAVGITNWPQIVATYLNQRAAKGGQRPHPRGRKN